MSGVITRGVLFVHSSPRAYCPHIESVATNVIGCDVSLDWTEQPAAPRMLRAEYSWMAAQGTGGKLASALFGWEHLRYEVTEEASRGSDGGRWSHTPELGIFHAPMDIHGNTMVPEDRIRRALDCGGDLAAMVRHLDVAVGQAWDDELEPFRYAGAGAPVRWLHQVG
ncbi:MAG: DUF3145 domain-containing protein [Micrococcales bacterium]|nr:DUF3145 domain-containing protein [Micrococcales bacterium]